MIALRSLTAALRTAVQPIKSDAALPSIRNFSNGQQLLSFNRPLTNPTGSPLTAPSSSSILSKYNDLLINQSRTIMKIFWQRPKESKRIGTHGWKTRMSTPSGRRIIMRRILRGRHILTH